jgi:hypothetical protein
MHAYSELLGNAEEYTLCVAHTCKDDKCNDLTEVTNSRHRKLKHEGFLYFSSRTPRYTAKIGRRTFDPRIAIGIPFSSIPSCSKVELDSL